MDDVIKQIQLFINSKKIELSSNQFNSFIEYFVLNLIKIYIYFFNSKNRRNNIYKILNKTLNKIRAIPEEYNYVSKVLEENSLEIYKSRNYDFSVKEILVALSNLLDIYKIDPKLRKQLEIKIRSIFEIYIIES